jgi:hypothetical protein
MSQQNVSFRRINGHIVPIRMTPKQKEISKGAGAVVAGAVVAGATGKITSGMMHNSAHAENEARTILQNLKSAKVKGPAYIKHAEHAMRHSIHSIKLEKNAFRVRHAGTVFAGALFGYGASKALNQTKVGKKHPEAVAAVSSGGGVAAAFAVRSSYLKGVGIRGTQILKGAFKRAVLKI